MYMYMGHHNQLSFYSRIKHMFVNCNVNLYFFCFILLTHEGSHREIYQEFQPSYDIFCRWCHGLSRPQVPCTPSLHFQIANSASTQSQQPVYDSLSNQTVISNTQITLEQSPIQDQPRSTMLDFSDQTKTGISKLLRPVNLCIVGI